MRPSQRIGIALFVVIVSIPTAQVFRDTPDLDVTTAAVTTGRVIHRLSANGVLEPVSTVQVVSQIPGTVATIAVNEDSVVHTGQVLAELDASRYESALFDAESALAREKMQLGLTELAASQAQDNLSRMEALREEGLTAESALSAALARMSAVQAELSDGEKRVSDAQAAVDRNAVNRLLATIRSPIDGIVVGMHVVDGQVVSADDGSPALFDIAPDPTHLRVRTEFDEADINTLRVDDTAELRVDDDATHLVTGHVSEIVPRDALVAASREPSPSRQTVVVDVSSGSERLRFGQPVVVFLEGAHGSDRMRIPNAALTFRPPSSLLTAIGETHVPAVAVDESDTDDPPVVEPAEHLAEVWTYTGTEFVAVGVRTGASDDFWTELDGGALRAGDRVVTSAAVHDWSYSR